MNTDTELVAEVGAIQLGIRRMDAQIDAKKRELADLEGRVANARTLQGKLEPIVADLRSQRESLLDEVAGLQEKISALKAEYKKLRALLDAIPT